MLRPHRRDIHPGKRSAAAPVRRVAIATLVALAALPAAPAAAQAYAVGHVSVTFVDSARGNREVPSEVYYPAETAGTGVPVAPPPPGGFPVVTFGHGYLMSWSLYAYLWEALVPQGFVVALPKTESGFLPNHLALGLDLAFLVEAMRQEGARAGSPFFGAIAPTAAVMGHSMGGGASILAAAADSTVTAVANLAAAETNPSAIAAAAGLVLPALLFSGTHDCVTPPEDHQLPIYQALASACKAWVSLSGGSHCQFAGASFACELGEASCPDPTISRDEQHALTLTLLVPWLDAVLRGNPAAWAEFEGLLTTEPGIIYDLSCVPTAVAGAPEEEGERQPDLQLAGAAPNPFQEHTGIRYGMARPGQVAIGIYSPTGRRVRSLFEGSAAAGWHAASWDGRDDAGRPVAAGLYVCLARSGRARAACSLLLLR